jgi:Rrf2 family protein
MSYCNYPSYSMANSRMAVATHIMVFVGYEQKTMKPGEVLSSDFIAGSVNTNPVVVRRILSDLQKAGLIESQSGRNGGVRLSKPAARVNLLDIYQAVEGGAIFKFNPNPPNPKCSISTSMEHIIEPVFDSVEEALENRLKKTSLADLVDQVK